MTPRQSIDQECGRRGKAAVVAGCVDLLAGDDVDDELVLALGGPPARGLLAQERSEPSYWLRVWAARGLLWAWDEAALPALRTAFRDDSWRVREMALKVAARHRIDDVLPEVAERQDDRVARVRSAASRALMRITSDGA